MKVAFVTPTSIPITAFNTFGVNAKMKDDAIGRFGTGLKYAVAVILRLGGEVEVWIDGVRHVFYTKPTNFRDKQFDMVRMKRATGLGRWFYTKLPFTTELGKDWQLWQAYREVESNTRDENGETILLDDSLGDGFVFVGVDDEEGWEVPSKGTVIVLHHEHLADLWSEKDYPVFLERDFAEVVYEDSFVRISNHESKYLYFNGIRCYDLRNPAKLTYDFKREIELTEDRTIKNIWWIEHLLSDVIRNKIKKVAVLDLILSKSKEPRYEDFDLPIHYHKAEEGTFRDRVVALRSTGNLGRAGSMYWSNHVETPAPSGRESVVLDTQIWDQIETVLRDAGQTELQLMIGRGRRSV